MSLQTQCIGLCNILSNFVLVAFQCVKYMHINWLRKLSNLWRQGDQMSSFFQGMSYISTFWVNFKISYISRQTGSGSIKRGCPYNLFLCLFIGLHQRRAKHPNINMYFLLNVLHFLVCPTFWKAVSSFVVMTSGHPDWRVWPP